jgi:3-hydroxyisobutyrate dehydrogenase-like beta-hydroxyacid dehydrogenase
VPADGVVAIVAPGNMGAAVGKCLADHGLEVLTTLVGRGAASAARARAAGMRPVQPEALTNADLLLSIVPPGAALPFALQMARLLEGAPRKPVFVDCNAVSPATVERIAQVIEEAGAPFVDAGIIGPPPRPEGVQPSIYASGPHAGRMSLLRSHGLDIRVLEAPVGAASALKMSFAGITKGVIAVATAMALAAARVGATKELHAELAAREPALLASLSRKVPDMLPKAYRWVAEMQEIAQFAGPDAAGDIYAGASQIYERVARAMASDGPELKALRRFFRT